MRFYEEAEHKYECLLPLNASGYLSYCLVNLGGQGAASSCSPLLIIIIVVICYSFVVAGTVEILIHLVIVVLPAAATAEVKFQQE